MIAISRIGTSSELFLKGAQERMEPIKDTFVE